MGRRYLTSEEVEVALRRGKSVECFIGPFLANGRKGVRHLSLSATRTGIEMRVFETADIGSADYLDLYRFGPVSPDVEFGDADLEVTFANLAECLSYLEKGWPGCTHTLVNQGMVQEEYADYLAGDRQVGPLAPPA